jgi:hypothetical protein
MVELEKNTGGCLVLSKNGIPIIYRGCMNEYISLDGAPADMEGSVGDPHRRGAHYLQSNDRNAVVSVDEDRASVACMPTNAEGLSGSVKCAATYRRTGNEYNVACRREWIRHEKEVGDDSICFLFSAGICSYWSIRDPVPNTTTARIRFAHPWAEWPDGDILPEAVKVQAKIRSGSSGLVIGPAGGAVLIVERVTGSPSLRCVYPRGRGYHEIELTWPVGERTVGHVDEACFRLMPL